MSAPSRARSRLGGHLLVESLVAAGAEVAFGVPGIHALSVWDGAVDAPLRIVGLRTELAAGFAADGYARAGRRTGLLLTTTGPGALVATCALMEARTAFVPLVNVVSQVPRDVLGTGRGYLHEITGQSAALSALGKWHAVAREPEELPALVAAAFRAAATAPQGPAVLEVPVDVLEGVTDTAVPEELDIAPAPPPVPDAAVLDRVARLLASAERPVLWAGGGVLRSGAANAFTALAELLDAPAATTYMGKGAIPASHPLAVGSGADDAAFQELLREADVLLAVGTELGAETTAQWGLELSGQLVQVDIRPEHLGATYPAIGVHGDARATLEALAQRLAPGERGGATRAATVRERIEGGLRAQGREAELDLLRTLREAVPDDGVLAFDMTITGYLAAPFLPVERPDTFLYPLGSGTLGYAWPAAIGAKVARPEATVLAVHGDGGVLYSILELLSARQHRVAAKLLVVDDGGYGILRVYQEQAYGRTAAVDLEQPDFPALGRSLGVPVFEARPGGLAGPLGQALAAPGPALVHLPQNVVYPKPTE